MRRVVPASSRITQWQERREGEHADANGLLEGKMDMTRVLERMECLGDDNTGYLVSMELSR